ncbi:MAG: YhbY family RNA-binding protein [Betaproteobacteria bacterium]|jgi:putative YhbY family RNA-binding protein
MTTLHIDSIARATLRSEAHALNPIVMIGGDGLTPGVLKEADLALNTHHLIKIRVFGDDREARIAIYEELCEKLNAAPVQHIGKLLVLYRQDNSTTEREIIPLKKSPHKKSKADSFGAPKTVFVKKFTRNPQKRPKPVATRLLGNERVAAGGQVKRAKPRKKSVKKRQLG